MRTRPSVGVESRSAELLDQHLLATYRRTDRLFLALMALQWIAGRYGPGS